MCTLTSISAKVILSAQTETRYFALSVPTFDSYITYTVMYDAEGNDLSTMAGIWTSASLIRGLCGPN